MNGRLLGGAKRPEASQQVSRLALQFGIIDFGSLQRCEIFVRLEWLPGGILRGDFGEGRPK